METEETTALWETSWEPGPPLPACPPPQPPLVHRETGNCWVQHRRQPQWDNGPGAPHGSRGTLQEDPGLWRPVVTSYSKTACLSTGTGPLCRSLVAEVPAGRVSTQGDVLRLRNRTLASSGARSPGDPAPAVTKAEPGSQNFSKLIMNAKRSSCRPLGQEDSSVLRGQPRGPRTCMSGPTEALHSPSMKFLGPVGSEPPNAAALRSLPSSCMGALCTEHGRLPAEARPRQSH